MPERLREAVRCQGRQVIDAISPSYYLTVPRVARELARGIPTDVEQEAESALVVDPHGADESGARVEKVDLRDAHVRISETVAEGIHEELAGNPPAKQRLSEDLRLVYLWRAQGMLEPSTTIF